MDKNDSDTLDELVISCPVGKHERRLSRCESFTSVNVEVLYSQLSWILSLFEYDIFQIVE